jgi:multicomponent Na+:H+ antiporter subunit D
VFSALAFTMLKLTHIYPPELPGVNLDAEWLYRRLLPRAARGFVAAFGPLDRGLRKAARGTFGHIVDGIVRTHGPAGVMARTWHTGTMVLWVIILLAAYLIFYYL